MDLVAAIVACVCIPLVAACVLSGAAVIACSLVETIQHIQKK